MSIRALDEMSERTLLSEIAARSGARERGLCDYCHRRPTTTFCRFPDRHTDTRIAESTPCPQCAGSGAGTVGYGYCGVCFGKGVTS